MGVWLTYVVVWFTGVVVCLPSVVVWLTWLFGCLGLLFSRLIIIRVVPTELIMVYLVACLLLFGCFRLFY